MKRTLSIIFILCTLFLLVSCGAQTQTQTEEPTSQPKVNCFTEVGELIKATPDSYSSGSYLKAFRGSDVGYSYADGSMDSKLHYGIAYHAASNTIVLNVQYSGSGFTQNASVVLPGVVTNYYNYSYTDDPGYKITINGKFKASELSSTKEFSYDSYTNDSYYSQRAVEFSLPGMKYDACSYAKCCVEFFGAFLKYNHCQNSLADFGLY